MDKRTKRFAVGALLAAAAGYIAGILTAPKSGKETREDIKNAAVKTYKAAEKELKELHTELNKLIGEAGKKAGELKGAAQKNFDKAVEGAKVAKEKARELLSAVHEGDAEDKDLKQAIEEAKKAAEHLKSFLKK
ncbi:YtxH domain-containing protein [Candidatus Saccharibacteria bacterium]|nr:YtxH domain-containing protein [Candidatus Saccharibacteria bacterium]